MDQPPFLFNTNVQPLDGRLQPKERVAGFNIGDAAAAFPFSILNRERAVNYSVGGTDVAVFFKPGTRSALDGLLIGDSDKIGASGVFEATLDGTKLTFRSENDAIIDNETNSTWNILGTAISGPMTGATLTPIPHGDHFWFAWAAFNPETEIYRGAG